MLGYLVCNAENVCLICDTKVARHQLQTRKLVITDAILYTDEAPISSIIGREHLATDDFGLLMTPMQ
jgi:hypothetical protein